ncbi:MAG: glycosyltransferase family 39 protein [Planctomycetes bacterium]|nr:glycosyltransferase family 39 protein [Planctomycetota bacterium]
MSEAAQGLRDERSAVGRWLPWLAIAALYAWIRIPLLDVPLDRDEGAFGLIGRSILEGQLPYRDLCDHKPPGVFYLYALALSIFPATPRGIHIFPHLWNFVALLLVAAVARVLSGRRAGLYAAFVYALASATPSVQGPSASTELLLLLPLVASMRLVLAARPADGRRRVLLLLAAGACGAAACWIKQPAALPLLCVPLLLAGPPGAARVKPALLGFAWWILGGVGLSALVCAGFAIAGNFGEFFYWSFTHSIAYGAAGWSIAGQRLILVGRQLLYDHGFILALTLFGLAWSVRKGFRYAGTLSALLLLSALSTVQSGYFYAHYFAILCPALALGAGYAIDKLQEHAAGGSRLRARTFAVWVVGMAALLPAYWSPWYYWRPNPVHISLNLLGAQGFEGSAMAADYLREHMAEDEWMFIYGSEPQIPLLAQRRNANPYVNAYPLTGAIQREREFQERVWAQIEETRPKYLVFVHTSYSMIRKQGMDTWLEARLADLQQNAYTLETTLYFVPAQGMTMGIPPRKGFGPGQGSAVLYEFWVRKTTGK